MGIGRIRVADRPRLEGPPQRLRGKVLLSRQAPQDWKSRGVSTRSDDLAVQRRGSGRKRGPRPLQRRVGPRLGGLHPILTDHLVASASGNNCIGGCSRLRHWLTPELTYEGVTSGTTFTFCAGARFGPLCSH